MNQLFYNKAGGIVHKIRREKRTTVSEVIVRGKRIKSNGNWFYFNLSVESSSLKLNIFKTEKFTLTFKGWNRPVCLLFCFTRVSFCQYLLHFTVKQWNESWRRRLLMLSLLFRCFSLFLPHLRTLVREKRSENCLRFWTGGPSLCLYPLLFRNIIFFPVLTRAAGAKKNLLTPSASTIWILSTLTYTEFDWAALLAMF